jgi:hypothetical protein
VVVSRGSEPRDFGDAGSRSLLEDGQFRIFAVSWISSRAARNGQIRRDAALVAACKIDDKLRCRPDAPGSGNEDKFG